VARDPACSPREVMSRLYQATRESPAPAAAAPAGFSWRAAGVTVAIAASVLVAVNVAVRHLEVPLGRFISSGVPPMPAFAGLLLVLALRPLLRRKAPRLCPDGRQALLIYALLTVGVWLAGIFAVRPFLPHLVALQYGSQSNPALAPYVEHLPAWYAPRDAEAIRSYWEGSRDGAVPWGAWLPVLLRWLPFFLALFGASLCLMLLLRRQWLHAERLSFPLLTLPLALTTEGGARYSDDRRSLFCHPVMWLGFGVAAAFNLLNIGHALLPTIPAPGYAYSLGSLGFARPWVPFNSIALFYLLEVIGFGYFVPLDISFSAWFFYLAQKLVAVAGTAAGYDQPGFPFFQEQSAGAYPAVGILLLWGARRHLAALWREAWQRAGEARLAWVGLAVCSATLVGWAWAAGLALEVAAAYFLVIGCFVLVYARMRAETGLPLEWLFPYGLPKEMLLNALSVPGVTGLGGARGMVIFSSLAWLSRHHLGQQMAAYQVDALKLADQARIPRKTLGTALVAIFVVGLALSFWSHLTAFHDVGSNAAVSGAGEYRGMVAQQEYQQMASRLAAPPPRDWSRLGANGAGFASALGIAWLRARIPGFPLHPLGFIVATAHGDVTTAFFPLFVAWLLKFTVLKVGGLKLYRRSLPFFLGLIIGHFTIGGILWTVVSLFISPEAARSYMLAFGG
jgi:hypothetical protein